MWWISPGTPASSTTKTGHHDIAEILLKVALTTINQMKSNQICFFFILAKRRRTRIKCYGSAARFEAEVKGHVVD
jgi:aspartate 1-decarboxylase